MEFVLVTQHETVEEYTGNFSSRMTIVSVPEGLLVQAGCASRDAFSRALVSATSCYQCNDALSTHKFSSIQREILLVDARSSKSATLLTFTDAALLPSGSVIAIHRVKNVTWNDNASRHCIGMAEATVRTGSPMRLSDLDGVRYVAIPLSSIKAPLSRMSRSEKAHMESMKCIFGKNITYRTEDKSSTQRSLLIPSSMICITRIQTDSVYSIVVLKPVLLQVYVSKDQAQLLGLETVGEINVPLLELIRPIHSAAEFERVKTVIVPIMTKMGTQDKLKFFVEFLTPTGRQTLEMQVFGCRQHVAVITFTPTGGSQSRS